MGLIIVRFTRFWGVLSRKRLLRLSRVSVEYIGVDLQEPAVNWIVVNSEEGYACVLKLKKQEARITNVEVNEGNGEV